MHTGLGFSVSSKAAGPAAACARPRAQRRHSRVAVVHRDRRTVRFVGWHAAHPTTEASTSDVRMAQRVTIGEQEIGTNGLGDGSATTLTNGENCNCLSTQPQSHLRPIALSKRNLQPPPARFSTTFSAVIRRWKSSAEVKLEHICNSTSHDRHALCTFDLHSSQQEKAKQSRTGELGHEPEALLITQVLGELIQRHCNQRQTITKVSADRKQDNPSRAKH